MAHEQTRDVTGDWVRACAAHEVPPGQATVVAVVPPVAVFNVDGEFFATDDTCTHADSSLADGYIDGDVVECAYHFAKFCIRDGSVVKPPARKPLRTYPVVVTDGEVFVDLACRQGDTDR